MVSTLVSCVGKVYGGGMQTLTGWEYWYGQAGMGYLEPNATMPSLLMQHYIIDKRSTFVPIDQLIKMPWAAYIHQSYLKIIHGIRP